MPLGDGSYSGWYKRRLERDGEVRKPFTVFFPRELHEAAKERAMTDGVSLNGFILAAVREKLGK